MESVLQGSEYQINLNLQPVLHRQSLQPKITDGGKRIGAAAIETDSLFVVLLTILDFGLLRLHTGYKEQALFLTSFLFQ